MMEDVLQAKRAKLKGLAKTIEGLLDTTMTLAELTPEYHFRRYLADLGSAYVELVELIPDYYKEETNKGEGE